MKKYTNAKDVLPEELVRQIQQYVNGQYLYIPQTSRQEWGTTTGIRQELHARNKEIYQKYIDGVKIAQLAEIYNLSEERIRCIIYERQAE